MQRQVIQVQRFLNKLHFANCPTAANAVLICHTLVGQPEVVCRKLSFKSQEINPRFYKAPTNLPTLLDRRITANFLIPRKGTATTCKQSLRFSSSEVQLDRKDVLPFIDNEEDFEQFLSQIQAALKLDQKSYEASLQNLRLIVQKLVDLDSDTRNVFAFLEAHPDILGVKSDRLLQNIDYLIDLGLSWMRLLKVLNEPSIWTSPLQHLQVRLEQLRKLGFVEGALQKVIAGWPRILTIKSAKVKAVVKVLMENCGFPKADVLTILTDSPSVLADDPEDIELKFQYIYFRMGITNNTEMAVAKIYRYSLEHIRCRHLILERMGVYAAPDNRGRFFKKNLKLERIIDSSDNRFSEKVASIDVGELHAFARTIREEVELEKRRGGYESTQKYSKRSQDDVDEDSNSYDSSDDFDSDSESGSDDKSSRTEDENTEAFDFDKVDYRKKR